MMSQRWSRACSALRMSMMSEASWGSHPIWTSLNPNWLRVPNRSRRVAPRWGVERRGGVGGDAPSLSAIHAKDADGGDARGINRSRLVSTAISTKGAGSDFLWEHVDLAGRIFSDVAQGCVGLVKKYNLLDNTHINCTVLMVKHNQGLWGFHLDKHKHGIGHFAKPRFYQSYFGIGVKQTQQ
jgi:hypothetical protein